VACQPAAPAAPASAPKPAAGNTTAAAPAGWQADWDKLVAAAKAEGQVVVVTTNGAAFRKYADDFEKAFPGITVQHNAVPTFAQWNPKVLQERAAGVYNWDVVNHVASEVLAPGTIGASGGLDPVRPVFIQRPDIVDDANWVDGFEGGWLDKNKQMGYTPVANVGGNQLWINTDVVGNDEIKTFEDLLNPKWQGRIELQDPRVSGDSYVFLTSLRLNTGSDALMRRLLVDQKPIIATDPRNTIERLIRGAIAVASGPRAATLGPFEEQGLTKKLKLLYLPEVQFKQVSGGVWLINKAPHPNAAKLWVNWFASKEGQASYATNLVTNSRRLDAPVGDPNTVLSKGTQFKTTMITEESIEAINRTKEVATEMLK
jgi:iron(III) transport system substrate-binding protein